MKKLVIAGMISLTACAMPPEKPVETTQIENIPRTQQLAPRTSNYVNITTSRKQILDETVLPDCICETEQMNSTEPSDKLLT